MEPSEHLEREQMQPLPDGWQVRENFCVGVEMVDEKGNIVSQHPVDSNSWRRLVLHYFFMDADHYVPSSKMRGYNIWKQ